MNRNRGSDESSFLFERQSKENASSFTDFERRVFSNKIKTKRILQMSLNIRSYVVFLRTKLLKLPNFIIGIKQNMDH